MVTISLKKILAKSPCSSGWAKVLHGQGKITPEQMVKCLENGSVPISYSKLACDTQFPLTQILKSNDLDDCLWALRCVDDQYYPLCRKFAVWSARQVQHLMTDQRSLNALDIAWRHSEGLATNQELAAALAASRAAACDAARDAACDAAWAAARAAACDAARDAACDAAWAAARAAACDAARAAACIKQEEKLKQILDLGYWVD